MLYIFLLIKSICWLSQSGLFFGDGSIITKQQVHLPLFRSFAFLLFNSGSVLPAKAVLLGCTALSVYGLTGKHFQRGVAFILWLLLININNAIYPTLTGGDFLFQQLLFFNIFLAPQASHEASVAFHNAGIIAIKIQVCLVYLLSALAKLTDDSWLSGEALFQTLIVRDFSLPVIYSGLHYNTWFLSLATYLTLGYQLLFPVLIWFKKIKPLLLGFGIFQHLFIALVIGLPSFGFIMIISYSIFYVPSLKTENSL